MSQDNLKLDKLLIVNRTFVEATQFDVYGYFDVIYFYFSILKTLFKNFSINKGQLGLAFDIRLDNNSQPSLSLTYNWHRQGQIENNSFSIFLDR